MHNFKLVVYSQFWGLQVNWAEVAVKGVKGFCVDCSCGVVFDRVAPLINLVKVFAKQVVFFMHFFCNPLYGDFIADFLTFNNEYFVSFFPFKRKRLANHKKISQFLFNYIARLLDLCFDSYFSN